MLGGFCREMSEARFQKLQEELLEALAKVITFSSFYKTPDSCLEKLKEIHECPGMTLEILRVSAWPPERR